VSDSIALRQNDRDHASKAVVSAKNATIIGKNRSGERFKAIRPETEKPAA